MFKQTLHDIRKEARISQRLWVKVLGMLQQNWCVLQDGLEGRVELVFFDDHGHVFDWLSVADQRSAQAALLTNGFMWMWEAPSFLRVAGVPVLPEAGARHRSRPIYSSGEYWTESQESRSSHDRHSPPTDRPRTSLDRFVEAQERVWYSVIEEIAAARKQTHWMWFVFPQLRGLGSSRLAQYFGLSDPREAAKYWDHDVLGSRLRSGVDVLLGLPSGTQVNKVFGHVDAMKLRSCMTLFEQVSYEDSSIVEVLDRCFGSERCLLTLDALKNSEPARRVHFSR